MSIEELLAQFNRLYGTNRDKGTSFEELILNFFKIEPVYKNEIEEIWMWKDFPYRENIGDTGIDLVARTFTNEYWAIQCKFYKREYIISKGDIDSFLATSSKFFYVNGIKTNFSCRIIVSTTDKYNKVAESTLENQNPIVLRIGMNDLLESSIDWAQFAIDERITLKEKYFPKDYQKEAIENVKKGFEMHSRGKLIMACGTGKTFTSLRCVEELLHGKGNVLFLVPSIALINQTLTEWSAQCRYTYNALVVCSDNKASKGENNVDLKIPSTTNIDRIKDWVYYIENNKREMNFIFSTYQSIDQVSKMQRETDFKFDIIVCDEAHRTTGVTLANEDESYFVKVHDDSFIKADKRLYMTATPRVYAEGAKTKAKENDALLCSMDNEEIYGPVFHNLTFSESVKRGLLTDYKVLILAVDEEYVKKELQDLLTDGNHEMKLDDSVKIMGCWNGLSKKSIDKNDDSFKADNVPMKRAVAFCNRIKDSKALVEMFNLIQDYINENDREEADKLVDIEIEHVDGSFNALEKKEKINWLKEITDENVCRILTNARCLSEGVDVPALDAVMFLNPRSSMVDIIQSVGRVMRKSEGKQYGYVILPIGISANENPEDALDNNDKYSIVWSVLQALRAHDDRFNNTINKIDLNKKKPNQISIIGIGDDKGEDIDSTITDKQKERVQQLSLNLDKLEDWKNAIYAKMVKKVGSRQYWESWAKDVAQIAQTHIERINLLLDKHDHEIDTVFLDFVQGLRNNLNESISKEDAIEMLAQHIITKPVFDALFEGYEFVKNNPVSQTMQGMMEILDKQALDEEKEKLQKFYDSVKERAAGIDNSEGKQKIILELYEKFFKTALPKEVEKLGIVYTPTECVDFIIRSVEKLLNDEFGMSMSDKGVHIIDGFTGTGTFIVQLLRSGIIKKEDMLYKYTNEIHANEIVLLAYYIAAINIEETFHDVMQTNQYVPFEGIVLTDTFQLYEGWKDDEFTQAINQEILPQNSERAQKQRNLPVTVVIGNPPYSVGQKNQNDNAENLNYPKLDKKISETYVSKSNSTMNKALYDAYIRAFRWATDRIESKGVIGFITNGSFIDGQASSGFRKSLIDEFTSIYVFNLRGNARTSGEQRKKEKDNVFGQGTRTPVCITCLVKNNDKDNDGYIHYYDIGDYLNRKEKLNIISTKRDITGVEWKKIVPDDNGDWINKANAQFKNFIPLSGSKKSFFEIYTNGVITSRDSWVYNYNLNNLTMNMKTTIESYNQEVIKFKQKFIDENINVKKYPFKDHVTNDLTKISWSRGLLNSLKSLETKSFNKDNIKECLYRPFTKQHFYYSREFNECVYKSDFVFLENNLSIMTNGIGSSKIFSTIMSDTFLNYHTLDTGLAYPLYWYDKDDEHSIFYNDENKNLVKHDNVTNYIYKKINEKYLKNDISKEDIFYYVYGVLHSKDYLKAFESDLKKQIPRIPLVDTYKDFISFSLSGRKLAELHINYEKIEPYKNIIIDEYPASSEEELYRVNKMKFIKKGIKSTIVYNDYITIRDIPNKAYEYVVNGKSAIEWIMERYAITIDKKSGIKNDPNDWCNEIGDNKYIFNLLLSIINVSVQTVEIIESLPRINFE